MHTPLTAVQYVLYYSPVLQPLIVYPPPPVVDCTHYHYYDVLLPRIAAIDTFTPFSSTVRNTNRYCTVQQNNTGTVVLLEFPVAPISVIQHAIFDASISESSSQRRGVFEILLYDTSVPW